MSTLTQLDSPRTTVSVPLTIDPRSFRVFEFEGDRILFDRSTATISELDDVAYSILLYIQFGKSLQDAIHAVSDQFADCSPDELELAIRALVSRGFFKYTPVNHDEQEALIQELLDHRPRRLQMLMAQGCNLGCRYCYAWRNGSNQKQTLMPWEIAKASVDYLVKKAGHRNDLQITFFGGEPLLNYPVLQQVVHYCVDLGKQLNKSFTFELITNGTLLTRDIVDFIVEHKFLLFISIDGWKEMHNYNRPAIGGSDMYDTIVENALYANEQYKKHDLPSLKVRANLTSKHHDTFAVGKYLHSLGFTNIGIGAIEPLNHSDNSPSALTEDQADALHHKTSTVMADAVKSLAKGEKIDYYTGQQLKKCLNQFEVRSLKGITCGIARNTQIVDNKGNIFPCHRYEGMEAYIIGNVLTGGHDMEKTAEYYHKVNRNATARCHSCWIRDYCAGGCAWLLSTKDGHLSDPSERECNRRRDSMERTLWLRFFLSKNAPHRLPSDSSKYLSEWTWGPASRFNQSENGWQTNNTSTPGKEACATECGSSSCSCTS